jgi:uncharacterized protein with HEPN domain
MPPALRCMPPEAKKYLDDIARAARLAMGFAAGKDLPAYAGDALLRSGVERQLEIAGEAMAQLARVDPSVARRITEHRRIIAFRNLLIHGYAEVDDRVVWDVVTRKLPTLLSQAEALLAEP